MNRRVKKDVPSSMTQNVTVEHSFPFYSHLLSLAGCYRTGCVRTVNSTNSLAMSYTSFVSMKIKLLEHLLLQAA